MRSVCRIALALLLVLPISCGGEKAITEPTGDYVVWVFNDSPVAVSNESLTSTPIEGFSGFNPPVAPGKYVIVVSVSGSPRRLVVTMQKPAED